MTATADPLLTEMTLVRDYLRSHEIEWLLGIWTWVPDGNGSGGFDTPKAWRGHDPRNAPGRMIVACSSRCFRSRVR